jgi:nucleoside phosphorylase
MKKIRHEDYQVCWICPLDIERTTAEAMLDERHESLPNSPQDTNVYTLGRIGKHNVAIAGLPVGNSVSTAIAASHIWNAFGNMRVVLLVGIGGGAPGKSKDIRLGDIVVSYPEGEYGGVIQVDSGKTVPTSVDEEGFLFKGTLNRPPDQLLNVVKALQAKHRGLSRSEKPDFVRFLTNAIEEGSRLEAEYPGPSEDRLFEPTYDHEGDAITCERCNRKRTVFRELRHSVEPQIHLGLIASANNVRKDGRTREKLQRKLNILCFEMEAAGIMNNFPCLVIRGISDYADSHKNDRWQPYAALVAAAYAKECLLTLPERRLETVAKLVDKKTFNPNDSNLRGCIGTLKRPYEFSSSGTSESSEEDVFDMLKREARCFRCGYSSHRRDRCHARPQLVERFRREYGLCLRCGNSGHWAEDCSSSSDWHCD